GNSLASEYRWSFTTAVQPVAVVPFSIDAKYSIVSVATDDLGNVYAYGYFNSPIPDVFVAKFAPTGTSTWKTEIATVDIDWPQGGIVVSADRVYIQRYRQASGGSGNTLVFVDALRASDGTVLWSTQVDSGSMPSSVKLDVSGNVYATTTRNTFKLDSTGVIVSRVASGGSANLFAFGNLFVAGVSYVDATNLTDRYLTCFDSSLVSTWTEWRRDSFNADAIALSASVSNSLLYVSEDSYIATASSVTFQPLVTAYRIASNGSATVAWTKSLVGGRITSAVSGTSGLYVMLDGVPPSLQKLDATGVVLWTTPISTGGIGVAEYNNSLIFVVRGSNSISIFDALTGAKK
ncbi:MAG: PQQ-binding-like beta-propeller repeat protein, partial [bacterium]